MGDLRNTDIAKLGEWWPIEKLLAEYEPGHPGQSWSAWSDELWSNDARMSEIEASVLAEGQREPVTLGNNGHVWDGHHRVVIAMRHGLDVLVWPVGDFPWRGPGAWHNDACGICGAMIVNDGYALHEDWHRRLGDYPIGGVL